MGLRFWRSIKVAPGVRVNLFKRGASVTLGPRGAHITLGSSGTHYSVGLPGSGLSYGGKILKKGRADGTKGNAEDLEISFFEGLTLSGAEQHFVRGLQTMRDGEALAGLEELRQARDLTDARYMAGVACFRLERFEEACDHLEAALARSAELGSLFARYGFDATVDLPIAFGYTEEVGPDRYGATLLLAEASQESGQPERAFTSLQALSRELPGSATVALSLAEIHLALHRAEAAVSVLADKEAPEPLATTLRIVRGRALRELSLSEPSLQALVVTSRQIKSLPGPIARALRYERALTLEALARGDDAREELLAIYAEDPAFLDVARRLGRP